MLYLYRCARVSVVWLHTCAYAYIRNYFWWNILCKCRWPSRGAIRTIKKLQTTKVVTLPDAVSTPASTDILFSDCLGGTVSDETAGRSRQSCAGDSGLLVDLELATASPCHTSWNHARLKEGEASAREESGPSLARSADITRDLGHTRRSTIFVPFWSFIAFLIGPLSLAIVDKSLRPVPGSTWSDGVGPWACGLRCLGKRMSCAPRSESALLLLSLSQHCSSSQSVVDSSIKAVLRRRRSYSPFHSPPAAPVSLSLRFFTLGEFQISVEERRILFCDLFFFFATVPLLRLSKAKPCIVPLFWSRKLVLIISHYEFGDVGDVCSGILITAVSKWPFQVATGSRQEPSGTAKYVPFFLHSPPPFFFNCSALIACRPLTEHKVTSSFPPFPPFFNECFFFWKALPSLKCFLALRDEVGSLSFETGQIIVRWRWQSSFGMPKKKKK